MTRKQKMLVETEDEKDQASDAISSQILNMLSFLK